MRAKNKNYFNYLILAAMGLSGAAALVYEIISSKFFSYFFGADTYSNATMLSAFLLGIALGSLLMSRVIKRIENKRLAFVILQFCIGAYALIFLPNLNQFPNLLSFFYRFSGSSFVLLTFSKFLGGVLYLLFPTTLLGACFPLAGSLLIKDVGKVGIDLGILYSLDTFGAILGACAAGFFLLPILGLRMTSLIGALLNFGSGFLILEKRLKSVAIFGAGCFAFLLLSFLFPTDLLPKVYPESSQGSLESASEEIPERKVVFRKNTPYGVVSVLKDTRYAEPYLKLYIDKRDQCATGSTSERAISHLALANFDKESLKVLNIGLGCGFTLDAILEHDSVKEVDVVEINLVVAEVADKYFSEANHHALKDERVNLIIDDAAHFLLTTGKRYDAIIVDVENPGIPHSSPLYTVEYFQIIAEHLTDKGIFGLWAMFNDYNYMRDVYYSIKETFPHVYLTLDYGDVPIFLAAKRELNTTKLKENLYYPEKNGFTGFSTELVNKFENDTGYTLNTLDNPILEYFGIEKMKEWLEE